MKWLFFVVFCLCGFVSCFDDKSVQTVPSVTESKKKIVELNEQAEGYSGENAYAHVQKLVEMGPRLSGSPEYNKMLDYLQSKLESYGWTVERQKFESDTPVGKRQFVNLRARLKDGLSWNKNAEGVIGCHIDTKEFSFEFVAANDGASHAGVLLDLARVWGRSLELSSKMGGVELVFFDGEEAFGKYLDPESDGLFGSKHYVQTLRKDQPFPKWMVNLDMLGAQNLRIRIPYDTHDRLYQLYQQVKREMNLSDRVFGVSENVIYDDHLPFQEANVPSINFIADFSEGNWWHTERDNLELISPKSLKTSGDFIFHFIQKLTP